MRAYVDENFKDQDFTDQSKRAAAIDDLCAQHKEFARPSVAAKFSHFLKKAAAAAGQNEADFTRAPAKKVSEALLVQPTPQPEPEGLAKELKDKSNLPPKQTDTIAPTAVMGEQNGRTIAHLLDVSTRIIEKEAEPMTEAEIKDVGQMCENALNPIFVNHPNAGQYLSGGTALMFCAKKIIAARDKRKKRDKDAPKPNEARQIPKPADPPRAETETDAPPINRDESPAMPPTDGGLSVGRNVRNG